MRTLITLLIITMLALSGCDCATQKPCCPPKDVVVFIPTPMGPMPIAIEKGFFNKDKEGKDWMGLETYNELMGEEEPSEEDDETQPI